MAAKIDHLGDQLKAITEYCQSMRKTLMKDKDEMAKEKDELEKKRKEIEEEVEKAREKREALTRERNELARKKAEIEKEKKEWEEEKAKIAERFPIESDVVHLDVGGTRFKTYRSTLNKVFLSLSTKKKKKKRNNRFVIDVFSLPLNVFFVSLHLLIIFF